MEVSAGPSGPVVAPSARRRLVLGGGCLLLAVLLPLLRQRGVRSWQSIWGEDGFLLYQDAAGSAPLASLFDGYSGYLVLAPRVLALPSRWLPVTALPVYFAVAAVVVTAALAGLVHRWTRTWISSPAVRLALAVLVVLMPAAGPENTATLTNTIWMFAAVAPWAILSREDGPADVVAR